MSTEQARPRSPAEIATTLRLANDSIARKAYGFGAERTNFEFFCECGDLRCHEALWLTVAEYYVARPGALIAHARQSRMEAQAPDVVAPASG